MSAFSLLLLILILNLMEGIRVSNLGNLVQPKSINQFTHCTIRKISVFALSNFVYALPITRAASASSSNELIVEGMRLFRIGELVGSISEFDLAIAQNYKLGDYLWQRGLSLYFNGDYKIASEQFRRDVARNPRDTEEALWALFSEAQSNKDFERARRNMIHLNAPDPRPIMKSIYNIFSASELSESKMEYLKLTEFEIMNVSDYFYANLYLSLYEDVKMGNCGKSRYFIKNALNLSYAKQSNDYMISVAQYQLGRIENIYNCM